MVAAVDEVVVQAALETVEEEWEERADMVGTVAHEAAADCHSSRSAVPSK